MLSKNDYRKMIAKPLQEEYGCEILDVAWTSLDEAYSFDIIAIHEDKKSETVTLVVVDSEDNIKESSKELGLATLAWIDEYRKLLNIVPNEIEYGTYEVLNAEQEGQKEKGILKYESIFKAKIHWEKRETE